ADQVAGSAAESHVTAIGGDRGEFAEAIPLRPRKADAHALGGAALAVAHEDVAEGDGDAGEAFALERDVAAIRGNRRYVAIAVERPYVDAHALGDPALAVVHEDILPSVRVPADEVAGIAFESHVPSVGGDRRRKAEDVAAIPLNPRRVDA